MRKNLFLALLSHSIKNFSPFSPFELRTPLCGLKRCVYYSVDLGTVLMRSESLQEVTTWRGHSDETAQTCVRAWVAQ